MVLLYWWWRLVQGGLGKKQDQKTLLKMHAVHTVVVWVGWLFLCFVLFFDDDFIVQESYKLYWESHQITESNRDTWFNRAWLLCWTENAACFCFLLLIINNKPFYYPEGVRGFLIFCQTIFLHVSADLPGLPIPFHFVFYFTLWIWEL